MAQALDVAVLVSELFDSLGIPHVLGGSVASTYYGEWRTTNDVDFAVAMKPAQIDAFVGRAESNFIVDPRFVREAVSDLRLFTMIHRGTFMKVDVYVRARSGFFQSQLERARHAQIRRSPVGEATIQTAEDVVLQKLSWYRQGDCVSDRQWRDVVGVLRVWQDRMDVVYLERWAQELGVADLLHAALKELRATDA